MKRLLALPLVVAAACGSQSTPSTTGRSALAASGGTGRYLVVFKSETLPANAAAAVKAAGGRVDRALSRIGVVSVSAGAGFGPAMAKNASVLAVGQERFHALPQSTAAEVSAASSGPTATDDLSAKYGWDMRRINAPAVWAALPLRTANVATVAVLDVGVMETHPDLVGQVISSKSTAYCSTSGGANNSAGYPVYATLIDFDAHPEWSPADGCTPAAATYEWHGTHVAGTIAAKFGGGRAVGVDPDARIAVYKVFDRYRYTDADGLHDTVGAFDGALFDAIVDAAASHIPVVSMSLGGEAVRSNKEDNASWLAWNRVAQFANQAGVVMVASAGNEELNLNGKIAHLPSDIPTILSTSASGISKLTLTGGQYVPAAGATDTLASYSNYGAASVDVTAPGGDCASEGCFIQYFIVSDGISATGAATYFGAAGTSMATPHVSAVAAMVRALHPDWDPGTVRSYIKGTAQDLGNHQAFGHGMVMADIVLH